MRRLRAAAACSAARVEQEIRAYPRLYAAFYRALNASPAVRRTVGAVRTGVREDGTELARQEPDGPLGLAERRRSTATAVRLGLTP